MTHDPTGPSAPADVALVLMPVASPERPSLSLVKLRTALHAKLGDAVSSRLLYLCHDFARWVSAGPKVGGLGLHDVLLDYHYVGLADWFFRAVAFPDVPDNAEAYFRRYFPGKSAEVKAFKAALLAKRRGLREHLEGLIDTYRLDQERVVGFTSLFVQNGAVFAMARLLKQRNPDIVVLMGGTNCDTPMGEEIARNVEAIDYVFSGPSMHGFPEAVRACLDGDRETCDRLPGVFSARHPEGLSGQRMGQQDDIDVPVDLDYEEFFASYERHFGDSGVKPQVHLETSHGCWWGARSHCTFCGLNGDTMAYRAMSPGRAIAQFNDVFERYGARSSAYFTADNIMPANYIDEVLPYIDTPPDARIFYEVKASLSMEQLKVMAEAGVTWIQPGIEALSTTSLRLMKKGTTVFTNLRLLKGCLRYGIEPIWSVLVGFPEEPEAVYAKYVDDLPLLTHLRPPKGVAAIHFDRYSPYFVQAEQYGLQLEPVEFYGYCFPFPEASIRNMAYYFTDTRYDAPHFTNVAKWIGPLQACVRGWRGRWELDGRDIWDVKGSELQGPRLELRRGDGPARIFDSRGDETLEYELEDDAARLLEFLEKDRSVRAIAQYGREQGFDGEAALAELERRRLVWCEDQRRLGLVMLQPTAKERAPAGAAPA